MENIKKAMTIVSESLRADQLKARVQTSGVTWHLAVDTTTLEVTVEGADIHLSSFEDVAAMHPLGIQFLWETLDEAALSGLPSVGKHPDGLDWAPSRICDACGKRMAEGFCVDGGAEYYCSDACLRTAYTEEQWDEMYGDGDGDSYYTTWED